MPETRRKQIITDELVQGELLFRALVYWFCCLFVVVTLVFAWTILFGTARSVVQVVQDALAMSAPAILGAVLLLPILLADLLKVTNRFVGPIQQIRYTLRQLSVGEPARRVYLRRDDFWQELALYTNTIADAIETSDLEEDDIEEFEDCDFPCTDVLPSSTGKTRSLSGDSSLELGESRKSIESVNQ